MYCDLWWQYIKVQKLFKGGNYSRAENIGGNTLFQNMSHSSDGDAELKLGLTCTLPCWSSKDNSFFKVFLFQISIVPFLKPQMITSWRIFKSFEGHFNPKIFNPKLFNYESGVSLGLKLGVQNSGVKMFGLYVSQNISTPVWGWKRSGLKLRVQMFRVERSFYLHIINVIWALESRFFSILSC